MSDSTLLKVLCAAEAVGDLDEPTTSGRQFWVHPLNSQREKNDEFSYFYESIRRYSGKFF